MRRPVRVVAIAVGIVLAALGFLVLSLDRLIEANRERLLAALSEGFARPVEVGRVSVGIRRGLTVDLDDVRIADDPGYAAEPFVSARRVYAVVQWWPLLRGEVAVRHIVAQAPQIAIIRTAAGLNVDSLGRRVPAKAVADRGGGRNDDAGGAAAVIGLVSVESGTIRLVDRTVTPARETIITPFELTLSDLSVTAPVQATLEATVTGKSPVVIHTSGQVGPVGDPPFAAPVPLALSVSVQGRTVEFRTLEIVGALARDAAGQPSGQVRVTAPSIRIGRVTMIDVDVTATERGRVAVLDQLAFGVFGGTIRGTGRVDHRAGAPTFEATTTVRGLAVEEALAAAEPDEPPRLRGRLEADWTASGVVGDAVAMRRGLVARGRVMVRDGAVVGVNLVDQVLRRLPAGVATLIPDAVRASHPETFADKDTLFAELSTDARVAESRIHLDPLVASADDYTLRGAGTVTFGQYADLSLTLTASESLTADTLHAVRELRYALGTTGRLEIPFRVTGRIPDVRVRIAERFLAKAMGKALKDSAGDLLRRGLELFGR